MFRDVETQPETASIVLGNLAKTLEDRLQKIGRDTGP
jgi:hypothetical protein